jgi:hypothetical protein
LGVIQAGGAVFVAALAVACATAPPPARGAGPDVLTLAPGQAAAVDAAGSLRVRFDSVETDSRCPADVACIQAGDALVRITVIAADRSGQRYALHTTGASSVVHDGLTIALEALDPRPVSSRPIRPAEYRLTLRVRR